MSKKNFVMGEGEGKKETLARKPPYFEKRPRVICAWRLSKVANGKLAETLTSVKNKGLVSCMLKSTIHSTKSKEFIYFGESNDSNSSENVVCKCDFKIKFGKTAELPGMDCHKSKFVS